MTRVRIPQDSPGRKARAAPFSRDALCLLKLQKSNCVAPVNSVALFGSNR